MELIVLVPKVVEAYRNRFPETRNNAYKYFNYDRRVVQERVPRGDVASQYKGPDDFTDVDYNGLVGYAKTLINPILQKYNPRVACEDALHQAIRSFGNGMFDNKVNAGRYAVLLQAMMNQLTPVCPCFKQEPYKYSKKEDKKPEPESEAVELKPVILKILKLKTKEIPVRERARFRKGPLIFREHGKIHVKASDGKPNEYLTDFLRMIEQLPTKDMDLIRKMVGRWSQSKALIKEFLSNCVKECGMDKDYVKQVSEDVKEAVTHLNKLEEIYKTVNDFDMDEIKTKMEPLLELINKVEQQGSSEEPLSEESQEEPPAEESEIQEEMSKETSPETEKEAEINISPEKEMVMLKNAKEYTERLDKIAEEVEKISPEAALQIDMISDVIEGKRDASTLKFDADEARYMKNRFNFDVRKRDADEPYMDEYKDSNYEQVMRIRKNPEPIKKNASLPYQKVE